METRIKTSFLKSITALVSGSIVAQLIAIIVSPIMTRLYTPSDIGVFTFIITIVNMFSPVINGRYDIAIVTEPTKKNIFPLMRLSLRICLIFTFVISIGSSVYFMKSKENSVYSYAVIFILILLISRGVTNILIAYNNRNKEYKLMTSVYVIRSLVQNVGFVLFGVFKFGVFGLLFSQVAGIMLSIKRQSSSFKSQFNSFKKSSFQDELDVAKKHKNQLLYSTPAIFVNNFSYSSLNLFVGSLFNTSVLGYYSMSYRLLGLPLNIISNNVSKIFIEEASREYDVSKSFTKTLKKTTIILVIMAIPMVLCMYFFIPPIFEIVFGKNWSITGKYVRILSPMFGIRFIVTAIAPGLTVARKQGMDLILQLLFVIVAGVSFIITVTRNLFMEEFLICITISFSLVYMIYYFSVYYFSRELKNKL